MEQDNKDQSLRDAVRDAMQDAMRDQNQMMQQMLHTMQAMMARMEVQNRAQPIRVEERDGVDGGRERGFENLEAPPIRREQQRHDVGLPRYNEYDQPVCRVCNVILKSESLWPAHQASRKHHEAMENIKASAAGLTHGNNVNIEPPDEVQKPRSSSTLPEDFFDKQEGKRQKTVGSDISDHQHGKKEVSTPVSQSLQVPESVKKTGELVDSETKERSNVTESAKLGQPSQKFGDTDFKKVKGGLPEGFFDKKERSENQSSKQQIQTTRNTDSLEVKQPERGLPDNFFDRKEEGDNKQSNQFSQPSKQDNLETKQVKGALPEGFFDNKDADLRARGIEPIKIDINDAYKEFEKEIQDDLQEIHATVKAKLEPTYAKYKAKADQQRRQQSFEVGDLVWVYLPRERYPQGAFTKLKPKKIGPCQVLEKFGDNAYRVELPDDVFISDVFNIRHLTPYAGENSSLRSSFSEEGESDEDIKSDQSLGQSNQALNVPVPATQSQQATSGKSSPGSLRRSKRLQNKRA